MGDRAPVGRPDLLGVSDCKSLRGGVQSLRCAPGRGYVNNSLARVPDIPTALPQPQILPSNQMVDPYSIDPFSVRRPEGAWRRGAAGGAEGRGGVTRGRPHRLPRERHGPPRCHARGTDRRPGAAAPISRCPGAIGRALKVPESGLSRGQGRSYLGKLGIDVVRRSNR